MNPIKRALSKQFMYFCHYVLCLFHSLFRTQILRKRELCLKKDVIDVNDTIPKIHNSTIPLGTAGWQGYVWDLCSIRDCLGLMHDYDPAHPVFMALDKVAPSMTPEAEAFVRDVIVEYSP